ncbi:MAG TPA: hypothetical protein VEJ87_04215 [Acidimicrobiales bacterium]|nr:hypothetical protein [Acidimicrobiales bacterium]
MTSGSTSIGYWYSPGASLTCSVSVSLKALILTGTGVPAASSAPGARMVAIVAP